ncbi:MAG: tetratricopeptide repeat protein [Saprospirales bacterium]|nr:MAG: tetratricopeptide repeat protein [Saprospirales bacterium]
MIHQLLILKKSGFFILAFGLTFFLFSCGSESEKRADDANTQVSSGVAEIDEITSLIKEDPGNAEFHHIRATLYYERGVLREAVRDWMTAISLDSLNPEYYHRLSDGLMDDNQPVEAIEVMEDIVDIYPERVPSLLKLGELYLIMGFYDDAIQAFNRVILVEPNHPDALFMKGLTFRDQGDTSRALRFLQATINSDPSYTDAYLILGKLHQRLGNPIAERFLENAIRLEPDNPVVYHALAEYYHFNDELERALEEYRNMHVKFPLYAEAFYNSGLIFMEMDSLDAAYKMFEMSINVRPTMARGYYYMGLIYETKRDYVRALDLYDQAISLSPNFRRVEEAIQRVKHFMDLES